MSLHSRETHLQSAAGSFLIVLRVHLALSSSSSSKGRKADRRGTGVMWKEAVLRRCKEQAHSERSVAGRIAVNTWPRMHVVAREASRDTNSTQWNLIGRHMTAPPPLLSPSSILPSASFRCAFIAERENIIISIIF